MAVIQGATTPNELEIEAGGAARVTIWGPDGNALGSVARPLVVAGHLEVTFPDVQQVEGAVSIENLPAVQAVSGHVAVDNFPAPPAVQTVHVDNPVAAPTALAVNNFPTTQQVAGTVNVGNLPATQPVSGTVAVSNPVTAVAVNNHPANQGADLRVGGAAVGSGNRVPVEASGTVTVANPTTSVAADLRVGGTAVTSGNRVPVEASGTVTVANPTTSVAVSNLPAKQAVEGTVNVGNLPTTQQVAGTVTVANPVTQVTVGNLPATQPVSGTVGADLRVAGNPVGPTNLLPVAVVEPTDAAAEFTAMVDVAPAAAGTDGVTFWSLRNAGSKSIGIRRVDLQQGFSGTAAASRSAFVLQRYSGSAPAGGTTVTPSKKVSASVETTAAVLVGTAALTVTGVTFGAVVHKVASANQLAATTCQDLVFSGGPLILAPGEGLAIRASGATVLGAFLVGSIGWYEL